MSNQIIRQIGSKIRALRNAQDLTQEQLAEKANLSYKYLGEIERGEINPGINNLFKIAQALGVAIKHLVDVEEDANSEEYQQYEEIMSLLAGKSIEDLKKVIKILKIV